MGAFYSDEDVARWEKSYQQSIGLHLQKLATDLPEQKIDFHMGMLALSYETQGMIDIAKGRFQAAIGAFRSSVEVRCKQYERYEAGKGDALEAGTYQSLLIGLVTNDGELVSRLANHYRAENGTADSVFLGRAVRPIVMNDIDAARASLSQKRPRFEAQFVGYAECLEAIVNKDERGFVAGLDLASKSWLKVVSRRDQGLPYSVCFIQGVGLVRLAEKVLGRPISVANEHIPPQLLRS
jgi:hypothetical protein